MRERDATIGAIIDQVNGVTGTIATAVEEQSLTADNMSISLSGAARGSTEIARNIGGVAQAAQSTMSGTTGSQKAAEELARMSTELHELVSRFKLHSKPDAISTTQGPFVTHEKSRQ